MLKTGHTAAAWQKSQHLPTPGCLEGRTTEPRKHADPNGAPQSTPNTFGHGFEATLVLQSIQGKDQKPSQSPRKVFCVFLKDVPDNSAARCTKHTLGGALNEDRPV